MVYKARLLVSGRQKIAWGLVLAAVIVFLAYYPQIMEGVLAFLLGGIVPGTNIVVSPDVFLLITAAVFIIGTFTLVFRMYLKAGQAKRNFRIAVTAVESPAVLPIERDTVIPADPDAGVAASAAVRKHHAFAMFTAAMFRSLAHAMVILRNAGGRMLSGAASAVARAVSAAGHAVWQSVRFTAEALYTFLVLVWYGIEAAAKGMWRASVVVVRLFVRCMIMGGRFTALMATRFWQWAAPRLHVLDGWLEMQVQSLESRAGKRLSRYETVRAITSIGREYRKSVTELHPKKVIRTAHQKAGDIKTKVMPTHRHDGSHAKS